MPGVAWDPAKHDTATVRSKTSRSSNRAEARTPYVIPEFMSIRIAFDWSVPRCQRRCRASSCSSTRASFALRPRRTMQLDQARCYGWSCAAPPLGLRLRPEHHAGTLLPRGPIEHSASSCRGRVQHPCARICHSAPATGFLFDSVTQCCRLQRHPPSFDRPPLPRCAPDLIDFLSL